jgi:hypothetical protein
VRTAGRLSAVQLSELVFWLLSAVEGWQLIRALQGRLRSDDATVDLTADKGSVAGYSSDSGVVRAGS